MTICQPWRPGNSLNQLRTQANAKAPNRSRASDGTIGDLAHQAEACASQHNSCCVKVGGIWIVRALDLTHDPANGFDSYAVAEQLRLSRDPRIRYIISNRRITGPNYGWVWHPYNGTDPHTNHLHVSVWDDQARFDDTSRAWRITAPAPIAPPQEDDVTVSFPTFFSCAGVTNGPTFFGTPGQTCSWAKPGPDGKVENGEEAKSIASLVSGKWTDAQFASANHSAAAGPPVARNLINIVGDVPKGFEDRAVCKPAPAVDMAGLKQAVVDAVNAANSDPANDANLSPDAVASVADAVVTRIGQKLGTVTP